MEDYKDLVNTPVKLSEWSRAQRAMGYSKNWKPFTLCEAMAAHLDNRLGSVGPLYVINVLDPDIHRKATQAQKSLSFTNGRAEFVSDTVILNTLLIAGMTKDVDFAVDYNYTKNSVIILSLDDKNPLTGAQDVSFYEVDTDKITKKDIIGGVTAGGEYSGLGALQLLYGKHNQVANLILAPGYSDDPEVYNAMVSTADKINGHWQANVLTDLPLVDGGEKIDTISKAIAWKKNKSYNAERAKSFWPMFTDDGTGRIYHGSTLAAVELLRVDLENGNIPMETCSNKAVPITRQYFGEGSKNRGFDQQTANELNEVGISTAVFWDGQWVLWGGHTDAYLHGADIDPRTIFDNYMRMLFYCINMFQRRQAKKIDRPFNPQKRDSILNFEQKKLDELVTRGALVGKPKIEFLANENSIADMMNGDFIFDIPVTVTPQAKSLTGRVYYTDKGLESLIGEAA
jgi:hypothetical protein